MLSERPWKMEAVMVLLLTLGAGYLLSAVYWQGLQMGSGAAQGEQTFYDSLALTLMTDGVLLGVVTVFLKYHHQGWGTFLALGVGGMRWRLGLAVAVGVGVLPLALGLNNLCLWLTTLAEHAPEPQAAVKMFQESQTVARRVAFAVTAVVCAPVVEETLFRGVLYPAIKAAGYPKTALWGTSILFGAIHMNLATLIPLTVLAMIWVWLYEKTDTLLAPILAHATFNAANFTMLIFESRLVQWGEGVRNALPFQ